MPRVSLSKIQYKPKIFVKWLAGEMKERKIGQKDIAQWLGITQQNVSYKIQSYSFSYTDMLVIFQELKTDKETQIELMTL